MKRGGLGKAEAARVPYASRLVSTMTARRSIRPPPPSSMTAGASAIASSAHDLRASVEQHRAALIERLGAGEDGMALGRANARFLDACFRSHFGAAARVVALPSTGVAVAAVGSFGRGAVALRSDADIVVVVSPRTIGTDAAAAFAE